MSLQDAITNLQVKHSALVAAVRGRVQSLAEVANDLILEGVSKRRTVKDSVRSLRKQIEDDGQSLILDWVNEVAVVGGEARRLSEVIGLARAGGGGVFGPSGAFSVAPADVARIDYDPGTGKRLGLLVEGQETNGVRLNYLTHDSWTRTEVSDPKFGTVWEFDAVAAGPASVGGYVFSSGGGSKAQLRVIYVKKVNCRYVSIGSAAVSFTVSFDLDTGLLIRGNSFSYAEQLGDGWWKVSLYGSWTSATGNQFYFSYGRTVSEGSIYQCSKEVGDKILVASYEVYDTFNRRPPSLLKTQESRVTRVADLIPPIPANGWFNRQAGTLLLKARAQGLGFTLLTLGNLQIVSDSTESKWYSVAYNSPLDAESLAIGHGATFERIEYVPLFMTGTQIQELTA